ncbi:cysteine desulfurase [Dyadobacter chenwenxiniae]|uniref:cysteine desulfurase n=1 Tax=Dyadobacter chenwenxiniae TaxID=2906456 RepID=A0A9X1PPN8_9BACT|nr:family 2A encapsulin nanocompartment cargo protein cysteine desulfurase [Dyadobacter chenwenxiniae]MCF0064621.1 cysteine desulfurase [Dyadobacter chenwenxiniae]UON84323.1 cysteine desulfurase [Dyadobacter chenwenxiniae]
MSTNINLPQSDNGISGLPDVNEIEQLANELFKLLPNEVPQANFSPDLADHPRLKKSLNLVHERLPSLFEKGRAPGEDHIQPFDVNNPQTSLSDPHFPASATAAGSGVSPSVVRHGPGYAVAFPQSADTSFEPDVSTLWSTINTFKSPPQLPSNAGLGSAQYYFLSGAGFRGNDPFGYNSVQSAQLTGSTFPHLEGKSANRFFDVNLVRKDFPIFQEKVNGKPLIWFDNAATTQKPQSVIDRVSYFYQHENSNIHRAAHELAARATDAYEAAREKCRSFLNARSVNEVIFVRGATEAINLVAKTWGDENLHAGDEIILSNLEHHANIVPWQQLAGKKGFKIRVIPVDDDGQILLSEYAKLLNHRTRLVSFTQVSNALGTVTPAMQIVQMAHSVGAKVLVDGAQSVSHLRTDVQALNADWFVFSGHKVFGPTGIGVLYGKEDLLNDTQTWQGGGNMIEDVTFEHTRFHKAPNRFEAGTGNIADAVGLGAAIDYVNKIGIDAIHQYEHNLLQYATGLLKNIPGLRQIGTAPDKASVLSFVFEGYKTEEVGAALNNEGIAVRSGHHCAQPILRRFGVETTVRPSLAFYNTTSEIDVLIETLYRLRKARK